MWFLLIDCRMLCVVVSCRVFLGCCGMCVVDVCGSLFGRLWFVVCWLLVVVCCLMCGLWYSLFVARCPLRDVFCLLWVVYCLLCVVRCVVFVVRCALFVVGCLAYVVGCLLRVHCCCVLCIACCLLWFVCSLRFEV